MKRRALIASMAVVLATRAKAGDEIDLNTASQAALERLKGIGVALSERLLAERAKQPFADWDDLMKRVPGVGPKLARRLSDQGLRIGLRPLAAAPAP